MNKGFSSIFLIIAVIFVTVVSGAYYIGKSSSSKSVPPENKTPVTNTPQPSLVPTQATTSNSITANWKTFTYELFVLKLPSEWTTNSSKNPIQFFNYTEPTTGGGFSPQLDKGKLKVEVYTNNSTQNLEDYLTERKKEAIIANGKNTSWVETPITVNNQQAIMVKGDFPGFAVYIKNPAKTKMLEISFGLDFNNYTDLADQILATFKFN